MPGKSLVYKGRSLVTLLRLPVIAEMLDFTTGMFNKLRSAPTIEIALEREKKRTCSV